ncbi:MAG: hypothetical protein R3B91_02850 [Planctomycetaceae bacterium]
MALTWIMLCQARRGVLNRTKHRVTVMFSWERATNRQQEAASALALLNGLHRSDSGSGFPSSLNLHLTEPQAHNASPISRGHQKSVGVPSASTTVSSDKRQRMAMTLLASYASAVTLACLYLIMLVMQSGSHELENLPDVEPLDANEFRYAPENASLPAEHTLPLGHKQQFGHILVEPLRIAREPIEYVHFTGNTRLKHERTSPVLQLWVRFTNMSEDQVIAPLDRTLLFKRDFDDESSQLLANNFIRSENSADGTGGSTVYMLDHPLTSEWDIRNQHLGEQLAPGESIEIFLPSQLEGIDSLSGSALWRMHIRKGFHAATGHGVTTLVDIVFDTQQIEDSSSGTSTGTSES